MLGTRGFRNFKRLSYGRELVEGEHRSVFQYNLEIKYQNMVWQTPDIKTQELKVDVKYILIGFC